MAYVAPVERGRYVLVNITPFRNNPVGGGWLLLNLALMSQFGGPEDDVEFAVKRHCGGRPGSRR